MTWAALLARLAPLAKRLSPVGSAIADGVAWFWKRPAVLLLLVVLVLIALTARSCGRADRADARADAALVAAQQEHERAEARQAGVTPVEPVEDLGPALRSAQARSQELEAELARARKAVPGAKPVAVLQAATASVPAALPVLLGEHLRLEVAGVELQGPAGARLAVGTAAARRVSDGALLASAPWSAPVTEAVSSADALRCPDPPAPGRAWRVGPVGGVWVSGSGGGWLAGAAYTRRLNLWGWEPEVMATAAAGPGGGVIAAGVLF